MNAIRINFDNNFGFGILDPLHSDTTATSNVLHSLYVGLFRFCGEKQLPALASSWEVSENNTKYVFRLHETYWSDSHPVTAQDLKNSWLRVIRSDSPNKHFMSWIANVEAYWARVSEEDQIGISVLDDLTLQVTLEKPCPFFLSLTATTAYLPVPIHALDQIGQIGNGPYVLEKRDSLAVWLRPVSSDTELPMIHITCNGDEQWIEKEFLTGRLEISDGIPAFAYEEHLERGELEYTKELGVFFLQFQCSTGVFADTNMRRRIKDFFRPDELTSFAKVGDVSADSIVPWEFFDLPTISSSSLSGYNVKNESTEIPSTQTLRLLINNLDLYIHLAEIVKSQIEQTLMCQVLVEALDWEPYLDRLKTGNFDMALNGWVADYYDPLALLEIWKTSSEYNFSKYSNPTFDAKLQNSSSVMDTRNRFLLLRDAEELLLNDCPLVPIYHYRLPLMKQHGVKGITVSPFGIFQYEMLRLSERSESLGT